MSRAMTRALILVPLFLLILVVLFLLLRPSPAPETATTSESTVERPREKTFDLAVVGGIMTPDEITVDEGDQVNLRITSDIPIEFHLHGYDLSEELEPGEPVELSFDAASTGRFEIEDEQTHQELGTLLVQPSSEEG